MLIYVKLTTVILTEISCETSFHWQPHEVGIASHQHSKELTESINNKISREMFDSIVREVVEEIGVPASSLVSSVPNFDLNVMNIVYKMTTLILHESYPLVLATHLLFLGCIYFLPNANILSHVLPNAVQDGFLDSGLDGLIGLASKFDVLIV